MTLIILELLLLLMVALMLLAGKPVVETCIKKRTPKGKGKYRIIMDTKGRCKDYLVEELVTINGEEKWLTCWSLGTECDKRYEFTQPWPDVSYVSCACRFNSEEHAKEMIAIWKSNDTNTGKSIVWEDKE